jgi:3-phenylpropionate/trans-cinnamate dioxygenase ferredoxin reductase subunit
MAGLSEGYDQVVIRGKHLAGRDFSCFYLREGQIIAADCINRPQEFMFSKQAIAAACCIEPERLADEQVSLSALLSNP